MKTSGRSARPRRLKSAVIKWGCIIVTVVAAAGVAAYFLLRKKPQSAPLPTVEVESVATDNVNVYGDYAGRINAILFVEVRARVEGFLESMDVPEGSFVKKGQKLFTIDPTLYRANLEKARAQLNKARATADKTRSDLDRIRPLYEQNAASRLDLDNAVAAYEGAKADVVVREAELTEAELTLSYTSVKAPISGFISEPMADIGTVVSPSGRSLLATIVNSDTVRVDFSMTALDYLKSKQRNVSLGQRDEDRDWDPYVTITLADGSDYPYRGMVDFAEPKVDPKTGTFQVRAEMPNPDHDLLPGEFTRVRLLMDVRENAIAIPAKAIEVEKGGAFVYVVRPDSVVERRYVETGPEVDNTIIIERGLAAGEEIITEGYHKVKHGMKVNPVPATEPESAYHKELRTSRGNVNSSDSIR